MNEQNTLEARIRKGMEHLDQRAPLWMSHVDLDQLDMSSNLYGLLEQIVDSANFATALGKLGIPPWKKPYDYGFDIHENTPEEEQQQRWDDLTAGWKALIMERTPGRKMS